MTYDCFSAPRGADTVTEKDLEIQEMRRHYDFISNRYAELYVLAQDSIQLLAKSDDRVEKLEAELSTMRNKQRWIPVTERLPKCERGCEVGNIAFVVKAANTVLCGCYGSGGTYRDNYFRTWNDATEGVDASDVSHWLPLPEPPLSNASQAKHPVMENKTPDELPENRMDEIQWYH